MNLKFLNGDVYFEDGAIILFTWGSRRGCSQIEKRCHKNSISVKGFFHLQNGIMSNEEACEKIRFIVKWGNFDKGSSKGKI